MGRKDQKRANFAVEPAASLPPLAAAWWCEGCDQQRIGTMRRDGEMLFYVPACEHDNRDRRLLQLLREIELHCPCGARPESLNTHPHVLGCPVELALDLLATQPVVKS